MFKNQDRRSALRKVAASATAVAAGIARQAGGRAAVTAAVDAEKEKHGKGKRPIEIWRGNLIRPTYTPAPGGDATHWIITAQGGSGQMRHRASGRQTDMTASRLFHYLQKRTGGKMSGKQCLRLQGINWRILGAVYDKPTDTWTVDARICESNPDARPDVQSAGGVMAECSYAYNCTSAACNCGCGENCYHCDQGASDYRRDKYYCGISYSAACS